MGRVRIEMLGRFRMTLEDGQAVPDDCWPARRAMELVQLLALSERRRCLRDRATDALWPHLGADAGAANLRKSDRQ